MNTVTFREGVPGFTCCECDATFVEAVEHSYRESSEAMGSYKTHTFIEDQCPECGSPELDEIYVCSKCLEMPANEGEFCANCAPPIEECEHGVSVDSHHPCLECHAAVVDSLEEGQFRRDRAQS